MILSNKLAQLVFSTLLYYEVYYYITVKTNVRPTYMNDSSNGNLAIVSGTSMKIL